MTDCDHSGSRVFTHLRMPDGTARLCVQCTKCLIAVPYNDKHWLALADIPKNKHIRPWIEPNG